jgi:hypothetical protein
MSGASFGRSGDGMPVALLGQNAYAMVLGRNGGHYLAYRWYIGRPLAEWTQGDFYGHGGDLADEATFRNRVREQHVRAKHALGRCDIPLGAAPRRRRMV